MPEVSSLELHACRTCGAKSTWARGFVKTRTLLLGSHTVCVTCWLYRRKYREVYARWAGWSAAVTVAAYLQTESVAQALLITLALYAIGYVAVVLHELGHAATAVALGFHVPAFSIGGGLNAKVVRWRKTFLLLGPSPVEGLVLLSPASPRHYRKKMALILLAGSLVNILCAALGFLASGPDFLRLSTPGTAFATLWIGVNIVMALNLLPLVSNGSFGVLRSDGLQLLDLLKVADSDIEKRVTDARFTEAYLAFYYGDLERAHALIAPELESGGLQGNARILATAILVSIGKVDQAIELARGYLGEQCALEERAMLMNNLVCGLIDPTQGEATPAKLAEADELSAQAMEVLPMANAVRGTRAAVLVEKGAYREAIELLSDKRFRLEPAWARATLKATLALALAGIGDTDAAAKTLQDAAILDPCNRHLRRAHARLTEAGRHRDAAAAALPAET